jgi:hypothetical protein
MRLDPFLLQRWAHLQFVFLFELGFLIKVLSRPENSFCWFFTGVCTAPLQGSRRFWSFQVCLLDCTVLHDGLQAVDSIMEDTEADQAGCNFRERPAVIANLSARVGSISDNGLGGWYSYRSVQALACMQCIHIIWMRCSHWIAK